MIKLDMKVRRENLLSKPPCEFRRRIFFKLFFFAIETCL